MEVHITQILYLKPYFRSRHNNLDAKIVILLAKMVIFVTSSG